MTVIIGAIRQKRRTPDTQNPTLFPRLVPDAPILAIR